MTLRSGLRSGSIGLAVLGTVAWSVVAGSVRSQLATAAAAAARAGHAGAAGGAEGAGSIPAQVYHHALSAGFSRGFLVSAGIASLMFVIALIPIRVKRSDLSGPAGPAAAAAAPEPAEAG